MLFGECVLWIESALAYVRQTRMLIVAGTRHEANEQAAGATWARASHRSGGRLRPASFEPHSIRGESRPRSTLRTHRWVGATGDPSRRRYPARARSRAD